MNLIEEVARLDAAGHVPSFIASVLDVSPGWVMTLQSTDAYQMVKERYRGQVTEFARDAGAQDEPGREGEAGEHNEEAAEDD